MGLFDCINAICYKNKKYKYNKKDCNGYMLLMWFSHDEECIHIVEYLNKRFFKMTDEQIYNFMYKAIPKKKRYLKWVKGDKSENFSDEIKELKERYNISEYEARKIMGYVKS